jgi:hypothetical protein
LWLFCGHIVAGGGRSDTRGKGWREDAGTRGKRELKTNKKKYERSQYVIENTGRHVQNELKRTQIGPQLSAEMRALRVKIRVFEHCTRFGGGFEREGRPWTKPPGPGKPEDCESIRKSWEQSQEVLENKGHHFLQLAVFARFVRKRTAISPHREQMAPHFANTKPGLATRSVTA